MSFYRSLFGTKSYGRLTQNAGTAIVRLVEPRVGAFTHVSKVWYEAAATAHYMAVMRPLNRTTVASAASASQAVINITADPGDYSTAKSGGTVRTSDNAIAANDYCVYQAADGTYVMDTVASVATLAITMTTNVPTGGVSAGAPFWFFGIHSDTNPNDATAHAKFTLPASTTTYLESDSAGIGFIGTFSGILPAMTGTNEPVVLYIDNATNAGTLHCATAIYASKG